MEIVISRKKVMDSAKRIVPEIAHLVPSNIPEMTLLKMAGEKAFLEKLEGEDVENVRQGLLVLNATGKLVD